MTVADREHTRATLLQSGAAHVHARPSPQRDGVLAQSAALNRGAQLAAQQKDRAGAIFDVECARERDRPKTSNGRSRWLAVLRTEEHEKAHPSTRYSTRSGVSCARKLRVGFLRSGAYRQRLHKRETNIFSERRSFEYSSSMLILFTVACGPFTRPYEM